MTTDNDTHLLRRAAEMERRAERHWPADLLMEAADTIDLLPHLFGIARREGAIEALETAADELAPLVDGQHPAALDPDQWLRARAARLREEQP